MIDQLCLTHTSETVIAPWNVTASRPPQTPAPGTITPIDQHRMEQL